MNKAKLSKLMTLMVFFIFGINFIAGRLYWYTSIWWFDMPMHFLGGVFIGLLGTYIFSSKSFNFSTKMLLKIFLFVLIVGVGWEIFEIIVNNILSHDPFNSLDTISDIFFDISGGLSVLVFIGLQSQEESSI